jgi:DNA polymerase III epsilon subunit-like protein
MQSLGPDASLWPRKLKDLSMEKLGSDIQEYGKPHSPYEDAMAALELYKSVQEDWEKLMQAKVAKTNEIRLDERNSIEKAARQQHDWACHHHQQQHAYMQRQQQMMSQQHAASYY